MSHTTEPVKLPVVAVFDFDGTLTRRDSLLPFFRIAVGQWRFYWGLLMMSPALLGYILKLIPNWRAKEAMLTYFLEGLTQEKLQQLSQDFANQKLPKLLRTEALQRLRWHQSQGHQTLLVSASLEAYLLPFALTMGFDQIIGTQLEIQNSRLTGRILGKNCYGLEKVKRLTTLLGDLSGYCIYAYGDSRGDLELLGVANYPYYRTFQDMNNQPRTTHRKKNYSINP